MVGEPAPRCQPPRWFDTAALVPCPSSRAAILSKRREAVLRLARAAQPFRTEHVQLLASHADSSNLRSTVIWQQFSDQESPHGDLTNFRTNTDLSTRIGRAVTPTAGRRSSATLAA